MELHSPTAEGDISRIVSSSECFHLFDAENKQYLNPDDFGNELFDRFDSNSDGKIDKEEFENVWNLWIKPLLHPVTALIIVDVQNDFIDGSLALKNCPAKQDGLEVVSVINELLEEVKFDIVVYSIDYHPEDHISFFENLQIHQLSDKTQKNLEDIELYDTVTFSGTPEVEQTLWPRHCVEDTVGSQLHPDLKIVDNSIFVRKGQNSKIDSYSAFWDNSKASHTELHEELSQRQVTHVFVCGLASDFCVAYTALDAIGLGYATVLIEDAARGTDIDNIETMKNKLISNLCVIASSNEVENLANGRNTGIEFAKILGKHT